MKSLGSGLLGTALLISSDILCIVMDCMIAWRWDERGISLSACFPHGPRVEREGMQNTGKLIEPYLSKTPFNIGNPNTPALRAGGSHGILLSFQGLPHLVLGMLPDLLWPQLLLQPSPLAHIMHIPGSESLTLLLFSSSLVAVQIPPSFRMWIHSLDAGSWADL